MLRRLLSAWHLTRNLRYSEAADTIPWNDNRQKLFQSFMTSPAGIHLGARMRNLAVDKAMFAVKSSTNHKWNAGIAYGVQIAIAYLESHLPEPIEFKPEPMNDEEAAIMRVLEEASNG